MLRRTDDDHTSELEMAKRDSKRVGEKYNKTRGRRQQTFDPGGERKQNWITDTLRV